MCNSVYQRQDVLDCIWYHLQHRCTSFACRPAGLTTSVNGSEAAFHSPPGNRLSFWKTSSINSVCPASASVRSLKQSPKHIKLLKRTINNIYFDPSSVPLLVSNRNIDRSVCMFINSSLHASVFFYLGFLQETNQNWKNDGTLWYMSHVFTKIEL